MNLKNKKGVSVMIGYILLVVFALIIGAIVFQWLRSYVPTQSFECSDGTSIFITEADLTGDVLNLSLSNNGRFGLTGYFIHVSNDSSEEIPTIELGSYLNSSASSGNPVNVSNVVYFSLSINENSFSPGSTSSHIFDLSGSGIGTVYKVSVIPARYENINDGNRFVSCGEARRIREVS